MFIKEDFDIFFLKNPITLLPVGSQEKVSIKGKYEKAGNHFVSFV